ncbi:MAG TPA: HD domain-containing phosphohydrolase [Dehalococcoidia bacterium]
MATARTSSRQEPFFPIPKAAISDQSVTGFDLYVRLADRFVLYKSGRVPFDRDRLLRHNIDTLYVSTADRAAFEGYLLRQVETIMQDAAVPPAEKADVLYHLATTRLERLFQEPEDPETARQVKAVTAVTVDQLVHHRSVLASLIRLVSHDYRTYSHSVNVCAYAVALGARLRIFSEAELHTLGLAAMLHDIGKARLDEEILQKEGGLTPVEWAIMRRHPETGVELLRELGLLEEYGLRAVLEHHEAQDGSGYPRGLRGEEISLMGRILHIADGYDALTSHRPYRPAMTAFRALSTMRYRTPGAYDEDLLAEFVLLLGGVDAGQPARTG